MSPRPLHPPIGLVTFLYPGSSVHAVSMSSLRGCGVQTITATAYSVTRGSFGLNARGHKINLQVLFQCEKVSSRVENLETPLRFAPYYPTAASSVGPVAAVLIHSLKTNTIEKQLLKNLLKFLHCSLVPFTCLRSLSVICTYGLKRATSMH